MRDLTAATGEVHEAAASFPGPDDNSRRGSPGCVLELALQRGAEIAAAAVTGARGAGVAAAPAGRSPER